VLAFFSLLIALLLLVTGAQTEFAVLFAGWSGVNQLVIGVLCITVSLKYRRPVVFLIGALSVAQVFLLVETYQESFRLSMFRTTHEVPQKWRDSDLYQQTYAEWFESAGELRRKDRVKHPAHKLDNGLTPCVNIKDQGDWGDSATGAHENCVDKTGVEGPEYDISEDSSDPIEAVTYAIPFDYSCSEANNIVVSDSSDYAWGWNKTGGEVVDEERNALLLPVNDIDYLLKYKVTHMYGQCGGCCKSPNEKNRDSKFDVALFERARGRSATLHNCFAEMFQEKLDGGGYEILSEFTGGRPTMNKYENYMQSDYFGKKKKRFWMADAGHCRLREDDGADGDDDGDFFNLATDDEGLR